MCNLSHEEEIILSPPKYDTYRSQLFGVDLSLLMGADGTRGLPRVIVDAVSYLRSEGFFHVIVADKSLGSGGFISHFAVTAFLAMRNCRLRSRSSYRFTRLWSPCCRKFNQAIHGHVTHACIPSTYLSLAH